MTVKIPTTMLLELVFVFSTFGLLSSGLLTARETSELPDVGSPSTPLRQTEPQSSQNQDNQVPDVLSGGRLEPETTPGTQQIQPPAGTVPDADPQQAAQEARTQAQRQQAIERLVKEMGSLVPGEIVPGSPQEKALTDAATAFANRDFKTMEETLDAARADDKALPPAGLLWASMLFAVNDGQGGSAKLEESAIANPDYPGVFLAFARLAVNQRRYTDSLALLDKSVTLIQNGNLNPIEDQHYKGLYYDMSAELAMRQNRMADARRYVGRLKEVQPENKKIDPLLAEIEFLDGKIDQSMTVLERYVTANSGSRTPELIIAGWLLRDGRNDEVGAWVEKAAERYPDIGDVQLEFANYAVNLERFPEASSAIKTVEDANGEAPVTILLKAKVAFASESYGLAASYYEKLVRTQAKAFDAANMYALCLIESEEEEKRKLAAQIAENNFRAMPDNPVAQAAFGWILYQLDDKENAAALLGRATSGSQIAPEVAYFAAEMMQEKGQIDEAVRILTQAVESKGLYLYRARAKRLLKDLESQAGSELPAPTDG